MKTIPLQQRFGSFLADGGKAVVFLAEEIEPALQAGETVVLEFEGVENMTDSFANACFANLFERHPEVGIETVARAAGNKDGVVFGLDAGFAEDLV